MTAAWYRARGEMRRRWRAALLVVLLVGVVGGAVLTAAAGARRSSSAYERFREETLAADLEVAFDGQPDGSIEMAAAGVGALPQVEAVGRLDFPFIVPAGSGFYPYLDFLAAVSVGGSHDRDVDRPRVLAGRAPDPERADEIAITQTYAGESGLGLGDRATFESFAPEQLEPLFTSGDAGPPAGPRFTFVVTGIFDAPTFLSESSGDFQPRVFLTAAFGEAHAGELAVYPGGLSLRLRDGAADAEAVTQALRKMFGTSTMLEITPAAEVDRKIQSSIDVIVIALVLSAVVAGVAGALAIAQALSRHFAAQGASDRWLVALGMTRSQRLASQVITAVPIAMLGALVAVVFSLAASPLMPVGVARRAEPDLGFAADLPVLLAGLVGVVLSVVALATLAALGVARRTRPAAERRATTTASRTMVAVRRTGLGVPVATGVGMVLEPRGRAAWAVRSALAGMVVGVTSLMSVAVLVASVDTLIDSPARYGSPFDGGVSGFSGDVLQEGGSLLDDPRVARAGLGYAGLVRVGAHEVNSHALESLKGDMSFTLLDGHLPNGRAEVVLGRSTLEDAGVELGDTVDVVGAVGSLDATVVGTAVFPVLDERSSPGRGVLLRTHDLERISSPEEINADVLIDWADGVDPAAANEELAEATGTLVYPPRLPSDVKNLREVGGVPRVLATFLVVLAALAIIHALVTTVHVRRKELAVLRVIGFQRRQLASTLAWQATTIGLAGLLVGVPLGLIAGRVAWRTVATTIGVVDTPATPVAVVAIVVVAALLIVNVTAIGPSRSARNIGAAAALRAAEQQT